MARKKSLKSWAYFGLKVSNDVNAVQKGKVQQRIQRRILGKIFGRLMGQIK